MKQIRTLAVVVLLLGMAFGQNKVRDQNTLLFTVTGVTLPMLDSIGTQYNQWELVMTGGPATLTVTIAGCMRGGTCSATLATSSGTANQILNTTGVYDYYNVAAAWTGGTAPTVTVNRTATIALNGGGGSSVTGTLTTNTIAKGTGTHTVGNSLATDDGTTLTYTGTGGISASGFTSTGTATQDVFTEMAAPATPVAGVGYSWFDSTNHRLSDCNSSATCGTTVVAKAAVSHQFLTSLTAAGGVLASAAIVAGDLPTTLTSGTAITNAALTTPTLGTPASGTMTSVTGLPLTTGVTGTLPIGNGGTGTGSTLTGLVRGSGSAMTAAELSGDATTSGSNAVTVAKVNGNTYPANAGFTSGGIPFFSSTSVMGSSALLTANGVLLGGGSGATPTSTAAGAADTIFGVGAAVPPVFTAVPNCPGGSGYLTASHAFVCTLGSATVGTTSSVTAAAASAADQNLQTIASTAGTLSTVGKHVHLHSDGTYVTGASGNGTMTYKVKLCTVSGCGSGTVNTLATFGPTAATSLNASTPMPWAIELDCFTTTSGASGVFRCSGTLTTVLGTTPTALGGTYQSASLSIASCDTTVTENWQVTVADAGNSANNSTTGNTEALNWLN